MERNLERCVPGRLAETATRPSISSLQPKGSCWYCDQIVDNVRRFCSPACRKDYLEEEVQADFRPDTNMPTLKI